MDIKSRIKQLADQIHSEVIGIRRHIHQHPELSFEEKETGRYIALQLEKWGIPHTHGIADNGVVGLIECNNPSTRTIALRADIDALPIQEANEVPYKSKHDGIMHACGHDVHSASLLGAAYILQQIKDQLEGTIKLIFQPAEEKLPGGASIMIKEGVLENPKPASIFGQHVHPPLEAGKVGFKAGQYMASADEIYVTVKGKGGHGALPNTCIDPILISAHILTALQQIVSRHGNPAIPSVLTFGRIESQGGATNVIPDEVKLMGTFRTMNEEWRFEAHDKMKKMAIAIAEGMGGSCDFDIHVGYPNLFNNEPLTIAAKKWAIEFLGADHVVDLPIRMTAEDFAYYSQEMPACFYRLGVRNEAKGIVSNIHTNTFDIDEAALNTSIGLMAWLACKELKEPVA
ncbi:MAG: amidohydrolase [Saprospiraceae bacterium]|nr:amidohydrolase [Saprospiraceae bacterium]